MKLNYIFFKVVCLFGLTYNLTQRYQPSFIIAGIYIILYLTDLQKEQNEKPNVQKTTTDNEKTGQDSEAL